MIHTSRRKFLKGSLYGAASLAVPMSTWARPIGANDDIRIGFIGIGKDAKGRGSNHLAEFPRLKGCRAVAVCDADAAVLDIVKSKHSGGQMEYYQDFRKLLENKDVDAVVIATPNHTHTMIAIAAMQAGKHVYVEKPVSHNMWEGRMLAKHAAKHPELIVQHGMQRRSDEGWLEIKAFVKGGAIGKPIVSRGFCYKLRDNIGKIGNAVPPPASVDYNLWCGPREIEPVHRKSFHYDWHWQWQYGNGDIGNQGPHQTDVARWLIDDPATMPASVISVGGRFGYDDDATTANTQIAFYDFKPVPVIFEVRGLPDADMNFKGRKPKYRNVVEVGNCLECEGGYVTDGKAWDNNGKSIQSFKKNDGAGHQQKFLDSIRSGKQAPTHTAETGHLSAAIAHMANHSYRLGKEMSSGEVKEKLQGNKMFAETYDRMLEHLTKNKIDVAATKITLGPMLTIDPATEKYTGEFAAEANKLNMETYRKEFSLPEA